MESSNLHQARPKLEEISNRLLQITENLHDRSVEELGTGRPVNANIAEAISAIEAIRAELQALAAQDSAPTSDKGLERERTERAISEVNSEEFDAQA